MQKSSHNSLYDSKKKEESFFWRWLWWRRTWRQKPCLSWTSAAQWRLRWTPSSLASHSPELLVCPAVSSIRRFSLLFIFHSLQPSIHSKSLYNRLFLRSLRNAAATFSRAFLVPISTSPLFEPNDVALQVRRFAHPITLTRVQLLLYKRQRACAIFPHDFVLFVELRNDHKEITEKIDQNIQILHSARLGSSVYKNPGINKESVFLCMQIYMLELWFYILLWTWVLFINKVGHSGLAAPFTMEFGILKFCFYVYLLWLWVLLAVPLFFMNYDSMNAFYSWF